jgi:hypothetical protein
MNDFHDTCAFADRPQKSNRARLLKLNSKVPLTWRPIAAKWSGLTRAPMLGKKAEH